MKIGFLATHPIQYHSPLFRELSKYDDVEHHTIIFGDTYQ